MFLVLNPPPTSLLIPSLWVIRVHQQRASCIMHRTWRCIDWRFILHVIFYMFQYHSPISSRPHPLPQSPKDYFIHLCLFCYLAYRVIVQFSSVAQSCPTLCDPMNRSMPGFPVHHQFLEFTQTHVYQVGDAIQPSHPLSSPSPPAPSSSQHQGLFQ